MFIRGGCSPGSAPPPLDPPLLDGVVEKKFIFRLLLGGDEVAQATSQG